MLTPFARPLPRWAVMSVRVFLGAEGFLAPPTLLMATALRLLFRTTQTAYCSAESYCGLGDFFLVGAAGLTILFAILALIDAGSLRPETLRGIDILRVALVAIAGSGFMLIAMRLSIVGIESLLSSLSYQFWAAWPLVAWPAIGVTATLVLGSVSNRDAKGIIGTAWPVACALVTIFFLTYLLPVTDAQVAGLHWQGVVKLPKAMGIIRDAGGHAVVVRDSDPMIYVKDGYVVTLSPGDYTVVENCTIVSSDPKAIQYLPDVNVRLHVALGQVTDAPSACLPS